MDEMDGMAMLAKIQKNQPCVLVIILTAYGSISDAVAATRLGCSAF